MLRTKEKDLHAAVARYLKLKYPGVIFRTDFAAGTKMTMGQAVRHKALQQGPGYPDLFIAKAVGGYHGLFMELKRDISEIVTKDGRERKSDHLAEQREILRKLNAEGYCAMFACGIDHAMQVIDGYLNKTYNQTPATGSGVDSRTPVEKSNL
jgi:hypothetical protein